MGLQSDAELKPYPLRFRMSQWVAGGSVLRIELDHSDSQLTWLYGIDAVVSGEWGADGTWFLSFTCDQSLAGIYDTSTPTGLPDPLQIAIIAEHLYDRTAVSFQFHKLNHYWRPPGGGRVLIPGDLLIAFLHAMASTYLDVTGWLWLATEEVPVERSVAIKAAWGQIHLRPRT